MRQERTRDLASSAPRITHSDPATALSHTAARARTSAAPHPANIGADIGSEGGGENISTNLGYICIMRVSAWRGPDTLATNTPDCPHCGDHCRTANKCCSSPFVNQNLAKSNPQSNIYRCMDNKKYFWKSDV